MTRIFVVAVSIFLMSLPPGFSSGADDLESSWKLHYETNAAWDAVEAGGYEEGALRAFLKKFPESYSHSCMKPIDFSFLALSVF